MKIGDLISQLQAHQAAGVRDVEISDGYWGYEFEAYAPSAGQWNAVTRLILRPFGTDGRHTSGWLQDRRESTGQPQGSAEGGREVAS
jgi:hypothetical protein